MKFHQTTQARVKECLLYDEATGIFTWKKRTSRFGNLRIGSVAGSLSPSNGYWVIGFDNLLFMAHRLAWIYVHGEMPPAEIDHINRVRTDNRLSNLRLATRAENGRNCSARKSASGLKGAHLDKGRLGRLRRPWVARITQNGKPLHLGYFATAEEAHAAYVQAARELYGEFARAV